MNMNRYLAVRLLGVLSGYVMLLDFVPMSHKNSNFVIDFGHFDAFCTMKFEL